jgi:hypothetical protein
VPSGLGHALIEVPRLAKDEVGYCPPDRFEQAILQIVLLLQPPPSSFDIVPFGPIGEDESVTPRRVVVVARRERGTDDLLDRQASRGEGSAHFASVGVIGSRILDFQPEASGHHGPCAAKGEDVCGRRDRIGSERQSTLNAPPLDTLKASLAQLGVRSTYSSRQAIKSEELWSK